MGESFHGWKIIALAALSQPLGQGLFGAYQILVTPLIQEFGATQTQMGLGMTLLVLCGGATGAAIGPAVDRGPLRAVMTAGVFGVLLGGVLIRRILCVGWTVASQGCELAPSAPPPRPRRRRGEPIGAGSRTPPRCSSPSAGPS